jgi:hypothetical protein
MHCRAGFAQLRRQSPFEAECELRLKHRILHPFANKRDQQRFDATIEISAMNVQKSHSQSARRYTRRAPALGCANFRAQPNASENDSASSPCALSPVGR